MTSLDVVYCSTKEEHIVDAAVSPHALEPAHGGLRHTPKRIVVFVAENTLSGLRLGLDVLLVLLGGENDEDEDNDDDHGADDCNDDTRSVRLGRSSSATVFALGGDRVAVETEVLTVLVEDEDVSGGLVNSVQLLQLRYGMDISLSHGALLQLTTHENLRTQSLRLVELVVFDVERAGQLHVHGGAIHHGDFERSDGAVDSDGALLSALLRHLHRVSVAEGGSLTALLFPEHFHLSHVLGEHRVFHTV